MAKRLYEVELRRGKSNKNWQKFYINIVNLNGKAPDFGGINNVALVSHHMDPISVHSLCVDGFKEKDRKDVTIEEITKESLEKEHIVYNDIVEDYFLPHDKYPNIE